MRCEDCGISYLSRSQFDDHECEPIKYCEAKGCKIRVTDSEKYCTQHPKLCQGWLGKGCEYGVRYNETYCIYCQITLRNNYYASLPDSYHCASYPCCSNWVSIRGKHCSYHQEQRSEQNQLKSLVRQRTSLSNPQEVTTFTTWWNNNLATVVNYNSGYWVFLVVYEPAHRNISENLVVFPPNSNQYSSKWGQSNRQQHNDLSNAQNEASWLRGVLDGNNPILYVHPYVNSYTNFGNVVREPYVIKNDLPCEEKEYYDLYDGEYQTKKLPTKEPNKYLKPLDIVKSDMGGYYHVGVYLGWIDGEYKVCDFSKKVNGTRIHSWERFVEGNSDGEVVRYHPIIPFKNCSKMAQQIAWAERNFRENNYSLNNRNCEHLSNMLVYGINYSEQIEKNRGLLEGSHNFAKVIFAIPSLGASLTVEKTFNNNKGSTIKLTNELVETENMLGYTNSENKLAKDILAKIEVPSKQNCQIM